MTALIVMILLNYPSRPIEVYFMPAQIYSTPQMCDQQIRSVLNREQSKLPQALIRAACVKAEAGGQ